MISGLVNRLGRVRVTLAYAAALAAVAALMLHLGPGAQQRVIEYTSTNLRNLSEGRIGTLIGSAFVTQSDSVYLWLPGLVALLALGELLWHSRRLVVAFAVGHIGATLLVAIGIAAALGIGLVSASIVDAADVGMSYGAIAVLGTFTAAIPQPWRPAWAGAWLGMAFGAVVLTRADFTADGHAVALLLGMAAGRRFGPSQGWTVPRCGLLTVAAAFGYLLLTYGDLSTTTTAEFGLAGAAAAAGAAALAKVYRAYTNSSAEASIQSESQASGGHSKSSPGISHS